MVSLWVTVAHQRQKAIDFTANCIVVLVEFARTYFPTTSREVASLSTLTPLYWPIWSREEVRPSPSVKQIAL